MPLQAWLRRLSSWVRKSSSWPQRGLATVDPSNPRAIRLDFGEP